MTSTRYRVEGMDCASCALKIDNALRRLDGVEDINISTGAGTMTVRYRADVKSAIEACVRKLGYGITDTGASLHPGAGENHACHNEHAHNHDHGQSNDNTSWWRSSRARLVLAAAAAIAFAYMIGHFAPQTGRWLFPAATLIGLAPIARRAFVSARYGTVFSIEMLLTVAAIGALFIDSSEEAAAVVFLFLAGEFLEGAAADKARSGIKALASLMPRTALRELDDKLEEVPAGSLVIGDHVLVRPGERIPADAVVISGESAVDEAPVTGESMPVHKRPGSQAFAGTVNSDGVLRIRVTAQASDNTLARIIKLVEEAQESKAPTERLINRFSRFYTPAIAMIAALVACVPPLMFSGSWTEWIYKGLAVLLIGCPCALVISTPAAIASSLAAGARRGMLFKGGAVLEKLGSITCAAFDKTGTLTNGKPVVTDVIALRGSDRDILRLSAALEAGSTHPLATAILGKAREGGLTLPTASQVQAVAGKGVSGTVEGHILFFGSSRAALEMAQYPDGINATLSPLTDNGKTISLLAVDGMITGAIAMRDEPRTDTKNGLRLLERLGIRTLMLTGDNKQAATAVGRDLGMEVYAELLPQDKQAVIRDLRRKGAVVAKIGDGINDAPALAEADVGIAMGGGTDVALETADAVILSNRVSDLASMITLSRRTMANIRQNITLALGLKAVFLVTTITGVTGLWPAILADTGATVLVTLNALRLLRPPANEQDSS